jgi:hypothetical protein
MRAWRRTGGLGETESAPVVVEIAQFPSVLRITFDKDLQGAGGEVALWITTPEFEVVEVVYGTPPGNRVLLTYLEVADATQLEFLGGGAPVGGPVGVNGMDVEHFVLPVPFVE